MPLNFLTTAEANSSELVKEVKGVDWLQLLETWGLKLLAAVIIFVVGRWLAKRLSNGLDRVMGRAGVDVTLGGFLRNIAYAVMLVLVIMTALSALGVPTTSMFAILGAAGLAVGLALKDSLSNIASGVMLIVLRPFRTGDHVIAAGQEGTVLEVRVFQTRLRAFDHRVIILPNSEITTAPIINFSTLPQRRMDITVGVGYDDDLHLARKVLMEIAENEPLLSKNPEPVVRVVNLGESSVDLVLQAFARNDDYIEARSKVTEAVRNQLIEHGLNIPYPQRDLHVYHRDADGRPIADILLRGVADDGDVVKPTPQT
ncbi:mechanosensitive ion channel family protein [Solilutibacter tolerans]|uniref:Small-conductance mechanosensitive channel n=1 Tax=Solilutibacter tolerans TaxID=1604334 RepID=A0A1N6XUC7_9GAMM|nr:mechanosensitive ion channel domain-containing protein [Lysobacter tolerans]SIR05927.1 Small-conductance mechanosensitive channel [Lysobacter tolerans]